MFNTGTGPRRSDWVDKHHRSNKQFHENLAFTFFCGHLDHYAREIH